MPERYWWGAVSSVAVGAAVAVGAVLATSGSSDLPTAATTAGKTATAKTAEPFGLPPAGLVATVDPTEQADQAIQALWRTKTVDQVFPPTVTDGSQYIRLGVAGAAGCDVLPQAFVIVLSEAGPGTSCVKVLRATYTDVTQTVFATVGVVVVGGDAAARDKVWRQWTPDSDAHRPDMMPGAFAVKGTPAAGFSNGDRVVWNSQASNDGTYLIYAVAGFADGRSGSTDAQLRAGAGKALVADSPPVQAASGLSELFADEFANPAKG